jgi:hypothetical protein
MEQEMREWSMTEITIDVVVQDQDGCLTVSGPLRLLRQFVSTLGRDAGSHPGDGESRPNGRTDATNRRDGDAA